MLKLEPLSTIKHGSLPTDSSTVTSAKKQVWRVESESDWRILRTSDIQQLIANGGGLLQVGQNKVGEVKVDLALKTILFQLSAGSKWSLQDDLDGKQKDNFQSWQLGFEGGKLIDFCANQSPIHLKGLMVQANKMTLQGSWCFDRLDVNLSGQLCFKSHQGQGSIKIAAGEVRADCIKAHVPFVADGVLVEAQKILPKKKWLMRDSQLRAGELKHDGNFGLVRTAANVDRWQADTGLIVLKDSSVDAQNFSSAHRVVVKKSKLNVKAHSSFHDGDISQKSQCRLGKTTMKGEFKVDHSQVSVAEMTLDQGALTARHAGLEMPVFQGEGKVDIAHSRLNSSPSNAVLDFKGCDTRLEATSVFASAIESVAKTSFIKACQLTAKTMSLGAGKLCQSQLTADDIVLVLEDSSLESNQITAKKQRWVALGKAVSQLTDIQVQTDDLVVKSPSSELGRVRLEDAVLKSMDSKTGANLRIAHLVDFENATLDIKDFHVNDSADVSMTSTQLAFNSLSNHGSWQSNACQIEGERMIHTSTAWQSVDDDLRVNHLSCLSLESDKTKAASMHFTDSDLQIKKLHVFGSLNLQSSNLQVANETIQGTGQLTCEDSTREVTLARVTSTGDFRFNQSEIKADNVVQSGTSKIILEDSALAFDTVTTAPDSSVETRGNCRLQGNDWQLHGSLDSEGTLSADTSFHAGYKSRSKVDLCQVNGKKVALNGDFTAHALAVCAKQYSQGGKTKVVVDSQDRDEMQEKEKKSEGPLRNGAFTVNADDIVFASGSETRAEMIRHEANSALVDKGGVHDAKSISQYASSLVRKGAKYSANHYESYALSSFSWGCRESFTHSKKASLMGIDVASLKTGHLRFGEVFSKKSLLQTGIGSMAMLVPEAMAMYSVANGCYSLGKLGYQCWSSDKAWADLTPSEYLPGVVDSANALKGLYGGYHGMSSAYQKWNGLGSKSASAYQVCVEGASALGERYHGLSWSSLGGQAASVAASAMGTHSHDAIFSLDASFSLAPTCVNYDVLGLNLGAHLSLGSSQTSRYAGAYGMSIALKHNLTAGKLFDAKHSCHAGLMGGTWAIGEYDQQGFSYLSGGVAIIDQYHVSDSGVAQWDHSQVISENYHSEGSVILNDSHIKAEILQDDGKLESSGVSGYSAKELEHTGKFKINPKGDKQSLLYMAGEKTMLSGGGDLNGQNFRGSGLSAAAAIDMAVGDNLGASYDSSQAGASIYAATDEHINLTGRNSHRDMDIHLSGATLEASGFDGNGHSVTLETTQGDMTLHKGDYQGQDLTYIAKGKFTEKDATRQATGQRTIIAEGDVHQQGGGEVIGGQAYTESKQGNLLEENGVDAKGRPVTRIKQVGSDLLDEEGNVIQYASSNVAKHGTVTEKGTTTGTENGEGSILNYGESTHKEAVVKAEAVTTVDSGWFTTTTKTHTNLYQAAQKHQGKSISVATEGKNTGVGASFTGEVHVKAAQGNEFRAKKVHCYEGSTSSSWINSSTHDLHAEQVVGADMDVKHISMETAAGENVLGGNVQADTGYFKAPDDQKAVRFVSETLVRDERSTARGIFFTKPFMPAAQSTLGQKVEALGNANSSLEKITAACNAGVAAVNTVDRVAGAIANHTVDQAIFSEVTPQFGLSIEDTVQRQISTSQDGTTKSIGAMKAEGQSVDVEGCAVQIGYLDGKKLADGINVIGKQQQYSAYSNSDSISATGNFITGVSLHAEHARQSSSGEAWQNAAAAIGHAELADGSHINVDAGHLAIQTVAGNGLTASVTSRQDHHAATSSHVAISGGLEDLAAGVPSQVSFGVSQSDSRVVGASSSFEVLGRPAGEDGGSSQASFAHIVNTGAVVNLVSDPENGQLTTVATMENNSLEDHEQSSGFTVSFNPHDVAKKLGLEADDLRQGPAIGVASVSVNQFDRKTEVRPVFEGGADVDNMQGAYCSDRSQQKKVLSETKQNVTVDVPMTSEGRLSRVADNLRGAGARLFSQPKVAAANSDLPLGAEDSSEVEAFYRELEESLSTDDDYQSLVGEYEEACMKEDQGVLDKAFQRLQDYTRSVAVRFMNKMLKSLIPMASLEDKLRSITVRTLINVSAKLLSGDWEEISLDTTLAPALKIEARSAAISAAVKRIAYSLGLDKKAAAAMASKVLVKYGNIALVSDVADILYDAAAMSAVRDSLTEKQRDQIGKGNLGVADVLTDAIVFGLIVQGVLEANRYVNHTFHDVVDGPAEWVSDQVVQALIEQHKQWVAQLEIMNKLSGAVFDALHQGVQANLQSPCPISYGAFPMVWCQNPQGSNNLESVAAAVPEPSLNGESLMPGI